MAGIKYKACIPRHSTNIRIKDNILYYDKGKVELPKPKNRWVIKDGQTNGEALVLDLIDRK